VAAGGFGVEKFFVISEYLITMLLLSEHWRNGPSVEAPSGSAGPAVSCRRCSLRSPSPGQRPVRREELTPRGDLFAALTHTGTGTSSSGVLLRPVPAALLLPTVVPGRGGQFYLLWPLALAGL
jgi:hypothetical protein